MLTTIGGDFHVPLRCQFRRRCALAGIAPGSRPCVGPQRRMPRRKRHGGNGNGRRVATALQQIPETLDDILRFVGRPAPMRRADGALPAHGRQEMHAPAPGGRRRIAPTPTQTGRLRSSMNRMNPAPTSMPARGGGRNRSRRRAGRGHRRRRQASRSPANMAARCPPGRPAPISTCCRRPPGTPVSSAATRPTRSTGRLRCCGMPQPRRFRMAPHPSARGDVPEPGRRATTPAGRGSGITCSSPAASASPPSCR